MKIRSTYGAIFLVGIALTVLCVLFAGFGVRDTSWVALWETFFQYDPSNTDHVALREVRLPRLPAAVLCGAALGLSGALMQSITRNPLADPGLFGVNAGAAFAVVLAMTLLGMKSSSALIWPALIGAAAASALVLSIGGATQLNASPTRLVLAGAAVSALFLAITRTVLLISQQTLDLFRYWVIGGFDGVSWANVNELLVFFALGTVAAGFALSQLNALALGEDNARSLGVRLGMTRSAALIAVVFLCGATVSLAGPIAFIGLLAPHLVAPISGSDMRWRALYASVAGAIVLVLSDLLARTIIPGTELQAGVMAALMGGPALVIIARRHSQESKNV